MEALLAVIGDLLAPFIGGAVTAVGTVVAEAFAAMASLVMEAIGALLALITRRRDQDRDPASGGARPSAAGAPSSASPSAPAPRARPPTPARPPTRPPAAGARPTPAPRTRLRRWSRRLLITGAALFALTLGSIAAVNWWFLDDVLRWALRRQQRSGMAIGFDVVDGNLFAGRLRFDGLTIRKAGAAPATYDLRAETIDLDVRLTSAIAGELVIDELSVRGLSGAVARRPSTVRRSAVRIASFDIDSDGSSIAIRRAPKKAGRPFRIERLTVERADLAIADVRADADGVETALPYRLEIDRLDCSPLRRGSLVFDALYRTNAQGRVDGAPFALATGVRPGGRWTTWDFAAIPAPMLALAGGPLRLVSGGTCAVRADDTWTDDGADRRIHMRYRLVFSDLRVALPDSWTGLRRTLAEPVVAFLHRRSGPLPLEFTCVLDRDRDDDHLSLEMHGLGEAMWKALLAALPGR